MAVEIELKLLVAPEHANSVWRALARHPHPRPVTKKLFSAYYDTPDRKLAGIGAALRLRRDHGRWIQTIKGGGGAAGGLHQRAEHETEVHAQLPHFPAMAEAGLGELVSTPALREAFGVVFFTEFSRTSTLINPGPGNSVEVSLDRGEIVAEGRRLPICEIELELKVGSAQCLFDLALEIAAGLPVRLENRSKAQRAHELAAADKPAPAKAAQVNLDSGMPVNQAFAALAFGCIAHLQANESGLLEGRDPEYLHQARVALRRLRSVFRVFRDIALPTGFEPLLANVKTLGRTLGEARDWDVFLGDLLAQATPAPPVPPGIAALKRKAQAARRKVRQAAIAAIAAPAYTVTLIRLSAALYAISRMATDSPPTGSLESFASEMLARAYARVIKRGRRIDQLAFPDLHRLRIEVKRLRYTGEFFLPLAPKRAREGLDRLAQLQDLLGGINDEVNAWALLDRLEVESAASDFQQAVGYLRGHAACNAGQYLGQLPKAWARIERTRPWW
jgi:inorganic triphosphatase YgiF